MTALLTLVVPSYNSQDYLRRCLDSLVPASDDLEIIVVDDGSTDATGAIAREYAERYPASVRVITKRNGGHGSAVNAGLAVARGAYFRVVDSDDRLHPAALHALLDLIRRCVPADDAPDLIVTNYVYEKVDRARPRVVRFRNVLPAGRTVGWDALGRFRPSQAMMMHALTYRTDVLRRSGLRLPEHTFYVDNLFVVVPLAMVQRVHYLDVDLYRYHIGRPDQSVNERVMIARLDQHLLVNRMLIGLLPAEGAVPEPLRRYLVHHLGLVCAISSIMLIRAGSPSDLAAKTALWNELRRADAVVHRRLRRGHLGAILHLPGRAGRRTSVLLYRAAQAVIGFN